MCIHELNQPSVAEGCIDVVSVDVTLNAWMHVCVPLLCECTRAATPPVQNMDCPKSYFDQPLLNPLQELLQDGFRASAGGELEGSYPDRRVAYLSPQSGHPLCYK